MSIKYYTFNGMAIAMKRGSDLRYLHTDHLGSTSKTTNSSGAEIASRTYYAYGTTRSTSGNLQTDRTYTGQKSDETGLMFYEARFFDPALGVFVSPDTIVPEPGVVFDYNRYMYVRGNTLKYNDPSGHITVCFRGGPKNNEDSSESALGDMCNDMWRDGIIEKPVLLKNGDAAIEEAIATIKQALLENPDQPINLIGYSWGGSAALSAAAGLEGKVDLLMLIESEDFGRGTPRTGTTKPPDKIPDNVKYAVNLWASDKPGNFGWDNGIDHFDSALNIGIQDVNHRAIVDLNWNKKRAAEQIRIKNPITERYIREYVGASQTGNLAEFYTKEAVRR